MRRARRAAALIAVPLAMMAAPFAMMAAPALAETPEQLDALSRATDSEASGMALARSQVREGALLDAMATLERVLMNFPENDEARALHAGLFCRIDDRKGALVEFDNLRGREVPDAVNEEAREPCRQGG